MVSMPRDARVRRETVSAMRIPYATHVTEHVIKTKAGEYVQAFKVYGASFQCADDESLNQWHDRLNLTWRNIASPQIAVWLHTIRRREQVDRSRRTEREEKRHFTDRLESAYYDRLANETLMTNELYLTLVYRPVIGAAGSVLSKFIAGKNQREPAHDPEAIDACEKLAQAIVSSLARYEPERLGVFAQRGRTYSQALQFFSELINGERFAVPLPKAPLYEVLATSRLSFGIEVIEYRTPTQTRLGAVLGIKEYPTPTLPGMFNGLLSAPFPFVMCQSFTFLSKATSQGLLQRQYNRMANAGDFAVSQAEQLHEALDALTSNEFVMGDHHFSLQVLAEGELHEPPERRIDRLNDAVALARTLLADTGMTVAREDIALEAAFWAQLPGCFALRLRRAPVTSRNLAAMAPFHNYPCGRATGNHWGDALALFISSARSPYYFSLHASDPREPDGGSRRDTGHTFVCGPTGSGKTVFIGFLVTMLAGRGTTQVIFDKDHGLEILVRAVGGTYLSLANGELTGFNPLQLEPTGTNVEFLMQWLRMLVRGTRPLSTLEEADLRGALKGTLALPKVARRLSRLIEFTDATRVDGVHARLTRWCESTSGEYAWVFDNAEDSVLPQLSSSTTIGFDVTDFLNHEIIRGPLNRYLFHLVEQLLDGRPLVCWVDEFSNALADPDFRGFADNAPKTWRKLNGVLSAATQTTSSVLASPIARTIVEQTATKVFFPNPDASREEYVEAFGLTEREFSLVKERMEPGSRQFLIKQGHWSVVCELDLKGFDAELAVISGRKSTVEHVQALIREHGPQPENWLPQFLSRYGSSIRKPHCARREIFHE